MPVEEGFERVEKFGAGEVVLGMEGNVFGGGRKSGSDVEAATVDTGANIGELGGR